MSHATEKSVDDIVEAISANLRAIDGYSVSLTAEGKRELRLALNQLVFNIREEIRDEANE